MFDFDKFVNEPAMEIFGRDTKYRPKNPRFDPFEIRGDFHESFIELDLKNAGADIPSAKIVLVVRLCEFPAVYPEPKQGDYVLIDDLEYQVVGIEPHIPGSNKLILHEE